MADFGKFSQAEVSAFEAQGVCFSYGPVSVLEDLNLTIRPSIFYGIVGPNGCGKTTLLDLLVGSRRPAAGRVMFQGRRIEDFTRRQLAREVSLVPQEFAVNFPFTVLEVVLMGRHPYIGRFSSPSARDLAAAQRAMDAIGVDRFRNKLVTELSGGEKQRVVLARALAQETPVLILDEPTSNLDVRYSLDILSAVTSRVLEHGRTAVAVMHDLNLAAAFCQELIFIKEGRVHAAGPTREVMTSENIVQVFGVESRVYEDDYAGSPRVVFRSGGDN